MTYWNLIEKLRAAGTEWVSSETLRRPTGVSRAAISKQMRKLREMGFEIESSPRKGYRLRANPELFTEEWLRRELMGTRFGQGELKFREITTSTNDDVRAMAGSAAPEGSLVFAEVQHQGRGRRGRSWFGRAGESLQFSILLRPPLTPSEASQLPLLAAAAVYQALSEAGVKGLGIKWPNDVLLDGRKLCGILSEMSVDMEGIQYAVLGIGLNVLTPADAFPAELRATACSLASLRPGEPWSRPKIFAGILLAMEPLLTAAWKGNWQPTLRIWKQGSVTLGRKVEVVFGDGTRMTGIAEEIDSSGALQVRESGGGLRLLHSGEVSLLPPERG